MIRTAAGLVLAAVFAAVAGYLTLEWLAERWLGHPDPPYMDGMELRC